MVCNACKKDRDSTFAGCLCPLPIPSSEGKKNDREKPDLSLIPVEFLEVVARAFMHGEKKYGRYNFMNGMSWHRLVASTLRHIFAFMWGEDIDPESGNHHLGNAGAGLAMLMVYVVRKLGTDDRYKSDK